MSSYHPRVAYLFILFLMLPLIAYTADEEQKNILSEHTTVDPENTLKTLLENSSETATYYYNLGTVYCHLSKWIPCTICLEKAHQLNPHDIDTINNLSIAKKNSHYKLYLQKNIFSTLFSVILPSKTLNFTLKLITLVFLFFWTIMYFKTKRLKATFLKGFGLLATVSSFFLLFFYSLNYFISKGTDAINLEEQIVKTGPSDDYMKIDTLNIGMKITIIREEKSSSSPIEEKWSQVTYDTNKIGWIKSKYLVKF